MSALEWIGAALGLLGSTPAPAPAQPTPERREPQIGQAARKGMRIAPEAVARARVEADSARVPLDLYTTQRRNPHAKQTAFSPAKPPVGVVPDGVTPLAMDDASGVFAGMMGDWGEGHHWLGYPYLAELTQRAEYRRITETMAREMTRAWIKLQASGDTGDKSDKLRIIEAQLKKHKVQDKFRRMAELDGFFGRGHLYIDLGIPFADKDAMKVGVILDPRTVGKGSLKGIKVVEPIWTYPGVYNAQNPLAADFYVPITWYVMGMEVHRTRLLTFVSREMPDILKPAYAFGGLSMSQIAKPYVDNWLRTRQSVSDITHAFSVFVLSTDISATLAGGGGDDAANRAALFNLYRDNRGLMMINKDTEEFTNISAPLGTLDKLQAQAQEHIASVSGEPLIILTGISPSGLNATGESELQVWAQQVNAMQEHLFRDHLTTVISLIQLDQFGEIDPEITFDFHPLKEESSEEKEIRRKSQADTDGVYIDKGVLSPDEIRQKLASDADSPYQGLDLSGAPPEPPQMEPDPLGQGGFGQQPPGTDAGTDALGAVAQAIAGMHA